MLSHTYNEHVTHAGSDTPRRRTMRRHWVPSLLSREQQPAGAPVRAGLRSERLVGFHIEDGRVSLLDERCPHRTTFCYLAATRAA